MRTFKFRVWAKTAKRYLRSYKNEGFCFDYSHSGCLSDTDLEDYGGWDLGSCIQNDNFVVQQFTGLKDSKGVDVYEGDIVKFTKPDYLESFETEQQKSYWEYLTSSLKQIGYGLEFGDFPKAGFVAISLDPADLETGVALSCMSGQYMEVVGNIFEHE